VFRNSVEVSVDGSENCLSVGINHIPVCSILTLGFIGVGFIVRLDSSRILC